MYTNASRMRSAARDAWGEVQQQRTLAPGVVAYDTAGHGGVVVSTELFDLDPTLRNGRFRGLAWQRGGETVLETFVFEEDCDWAALMLKHPNLLDAAIRKGWLAEGTTLEYVHGVVERWVPEVLHAQIG